MRRPIEKTYSENRLAKTTKGRRNKTSDQQLKYAETYHAQFDNLRIRIAQGKSARIKKYVAEHGWTSINKFVDNIIDYSMANGLTAEMVLESIRVQNENSDAGRFDITGSGVYE